MSKKILFSTDIGSDPDDALALLAMLNHPEIDLKGIYTVNGLVDFRSFIASSKLWNILELSNIGWAWTDLT